MLTVSLLIFCLSASCINSKSLIPNTKGKFYNNRVQKCFPFRQWFLSNIGKSDDSNRQDEIDDRDIKEKGLKFKTKEWDLPKDRKSQDYSNGKDKYINVSVVVSLQECFYPI